MGLGVDRESKWLRIVGHRVAVGIGCLRERVEFMRAKPAYSVACRTFNVSEYMYLLSPPPPPPHHYITTTNIKKREEDN